MSDIKERASNIIHTVLAQITSVGLNPQHLSINMCLSCEEELAKGVFGYTNYVIQFEGMLIAVVINKEECILCQRI